MTKPPNPAAFPIAWGGDLMPEHGMTLRDHFAGQAMVGVIADIQIIGNATASDIDTIARACYQLADAMLAERAKESGQ